MLLTDFACHCPPRAVATPRAFSAAAIFRRDVAPAFCASRMMGRTLAANLSAEAVTISTALLRATWSFGLPRVTREPWQLREPAGCACLSGRAPSRPELRRGVGQTGQRLAPSSA